MAWPRESPKYRSTTSRSGSAACRRGATRRRPTSGPRLSRVDLYENRQAPTRLAAGAQGTPLGVCLGYGHNTRGELERAARYNGACPEGEGVEPLREERYSYAANRQ